MTDPKIVTPQDHILTLDAMQQSAPNGPQWAALNWALPLLRAMRESPTNNSTSSETTNSTRFSRQERQEVADWLKAVTNAPRPPQSAARMYERAIAMILAPAHERWTEPEAIREREAMIKGEHAMREIGRLAEFILDKFPKEPGRTTSESAVDVAIRLLSVQVPAYVTEHAEKLLALSNSATRTSREVDQALSEAAMILKSNQWTNGETAKLEAFIEEKFPGELDGISPVTVAIRLLGERTQRSTAFRHMAELTEYMTRHHADTMGEAAKTSDRVTADAVLKLLAELTERRAKDAPRPGARCGGCDQMFATDEAVNPRPVRMWICATCQNQGITQKHLGRHRLPVLDADKIPLTREAAAEILSGVAMTIGRAYPYTPSLSLEQWATFRAAMPVLVSALTPDGPDPDISNAPRFLTPEERDAKTDPRSLANPIAAMRALGSYLAHSELIQDRRWYPTIGWAIERIEQDYIKKCQPGTMNMMPVRCDACTAPGGTVHLLIPETQTKDAQIEESTDLKTLRDLHKAWDDLREIHQLLGAKPGEKALDAAKRLAAGSKRAAEDRIVQTQETIVAMAHQERTIASTASLESVRLVALGKLGLLDVISIMLDGM